MKVLGFKKFFISLGLGAMLMFGTAAAVSAAAGAVLEKCEEPENEPIILSEENSINVPDAYLSTSDRVSAFQYAAATNSFSFKWYALSDATSYEVALGPFNARDDKAFKKYPAITSTGASSYARRIQGADLLPGTPYTVRIQARKGSVISDYRYLTCFTLYNKLAVSSPTHKSNIFTFSPKSTTKYNYISGYQASYYSYRTGKTVTKKHPGRYSFSIKPAPEGFYKVTIRPYIKINGSDVLCGNASAVQYMAQAPVLSKKSNTSTSVTVSWKKVAGATSYTIKLLKPGSTAYQKLKTTTGLSYKISGLKPNVDYRIKVIANRGSAHSPDNVYYKLRLTK